MIVSVTSNPVWQEMLIYWAPIWQEVLTTDMLYKNAWDFYATVMSLIPIWCVSIIPRKFNAFSDTPVHIQYLTTLFRLLVW